MSEKAKFSYEGEEIRVSTDFDNGGLARVEERGINLFDCWPYDSPEEYKSLQANFCFHLRLDGCRNKHVGLRFHIQEREKEDEVSVVYANPDFPVYSYDGKHWTRMEHKTLEDDPAVEHGKIVSVEHTFVQEPVWIAYQYPYSNRRRDGYIREIRESPFCEIGSAGRSTEGRDIRQIRITDAGVPLKEKKIVWMTGLQHCAEMGAGWGLEGMMDFLLSQDPLAAKARGRYLFHVIPIVNVDAVSEGRGRNHRSGKNLNREWEKPDPVPEIGSIKKTLDAWKAKGNAMDIFLDIHGFSSRDGRWHLVLLPKGSYTDKQAAEYKKLTEAIKKVLPFAHTGPSPSVGYAAGTGFRRYGALSMSIDGWIYKGLPEGKAPDLSSRYHSGHTLCSLEDIKACGALFVKALVEFSG
jgi:hypothetical protein